MTYTNADDYGQKKKLLVWKTRLSELLCAKNTRTDRLVEQN